MTPSNAFLDRVRTVMAADTGSLAAATALKVHLAIAAFTPSPALTVASFTEATFTGYAALLAGIAGVQTFLDPLTGLRVMQLGEPAGGWHWQATGAALLPQTCYGYYVTDNGVAVLWGSALLTTPVTLTAIGDGVDVGFMRLSFPASAFQ